MTRYQTRAERRVRWNVLITVLLLHVAVIVGLIQVFTPDIATRAVNAVTQAFDVRVELPPTSPPVPTPSSAPVSEQKSGEQGNAGKKANPRDASVPKADIVIKPTTAPPIAGEGADNASGVSKLDEGTGASGAGLGRGAGNGGNGAGSGQGTPTVKLSGEINSAKDYPKNTKALRIGKSVVIDLSVGKDGRVHACRVSRPSPDAAADAITCRLATERFRFRAATDSQGNSIDAIYRWQQRWFY